MDTVSEKWPVTKGDFSAGNPKSCIAVVTLASSMPLFEKAAIWGSCKTENLGAEKVVMNVVSNCNIRYVLLCGGESRGHLAGQTLKALYENGIDEDGRILGSEGAIPFIENLEIETIQRFRQQVELIDRTGLTDIDEIYSIVDNYHDSEKPFEASPISFRKAVRKYKPPESISADILISEKVVMDAFSGLIYEIA
ncbi:tetrahydromethanopterin S-methyltransferase subunit A [Methanohalophilus profundi]|uniref:tetrahydromethanopterin S-methyltransferase subunit A n=1 Tax=Methanohalophilus profundi TaxID=2138083 RepID=UPI00101CCD45|nr:tetrahydromethanopterin S-methyltransferase subunit A [Methanohalophilus profundi]